MILDIPGLSSKAATARKAMEGTFDTATYIVSYVGKWKYPQVGKHVREFWMETPTQSFPLIEMLEYHLGVRQAAAVFPSRDGRLGNAEPLRELFL